MLLAIETRTHGVFHASKLVCAPVRADLPGSRASLAAQKGLHNHAAHCSQHPRGEYGALSYSAKTRLRSCLISLAPDQASSSTVVAVKLASNTTGS